jgi:predicted metalloprotease
MRVPRKAVGGGIGGLILLVIAILFGADPSTVLNDNPFTDVASNDEGAPLSAEDTELADFVSVVLADTEDTWNEIFSAENLEYPEPTLVLFSRAVGSARGFAQSAVGPFYCPVDEKVYIDLSSYGDLRDRYGAPGDFAQAYVIAHEVGHCLGVGHVGDALDFRARYAPVPDIMSYDFNPEQVGCVSNLNVRTLEGVYAHLLGRPESEWLPRESFNSMDPLDYMQVECANPAS